MKFLPLQNFNIYNLENHISTDVTQNRLSKLNETLKLEHLNSEEKSAILNICIEFNQLFFLEGDHLTTTTEVEHEINTTNLSPINTRPYRLAEIHKSEINKQVGQMLDEGIVRHSYSPWNSPLLVVPKKPDSNGNRKWRVVVDYRKLNEVTTPDAFPLPNIEDILGQLGESEYFITGRNAPPTFQRLMNHVLTGLQGIRCLVYLDDIVIYGKNLVDHNNRLREVFIALHKFNLKLQPDKCKFLHKEVMYLGHIISEEGTKPDPNKISAIQIIKPPTNQKGVKSFLGLIGYYRKFISNFAKFANPLNKLLRKNIPFVWDAFCDEAFNHLKETITKTPILQFPLFDKKFFITTDASDYAIGGVLSQNHNPQSHDLPIAYASRALNNAEKNYSTTDKEMLAIVWAVTHFRPYVYGRKFTVVTDHRPLVWVFNVKDTTSRMMRWRIKLEEYDFDIVYKQGKLNTNADALSRLDVAQVNVITRSSAKAQSTNKTHESTDTTEPMTIPTNPIVTNAFAPKTNLTNIESIGVSPILTKP